MKEFSESGLAAVINFKKKKHDVIFVPETKMKQTLIYGIPAEPPTGGRPISLQYPTRNIFVHSHNSNGQFIHHPVKEDEVNIPSASR